MNIVTKLNGTMYVGNMPKSIVTQKIAEIKLAINYNKLERYLNKHFDEMNKRVGKLMEASHDSVDPFILMRNEYRDAIYKITKKSKITYYLDENWVLGAIYDDYIIKLWDCYSVKPMLIRL